MYKIDTSARYAISISARQDNIFMMMIHRERINAAQGFVLINSVLTPLFEGNFVSYYAMVCAFVIILIITTQHFNWIVEDLINHCKRRLVIVFLNASKCS